MTHEMYSKAAYLDIHGSSGYQRMAGLFSIYTWGPPGCHCSLWQHLPCLALAVQAFTSSPLLNIIPYFIMVVKNQSCVFTHFETPKHATGTVRAMCKHCTSTISGPTNSTSNFLTHLKLHYSSVMSKPLGHLFTIVLHKIAYLLMLHPFVCLYHKLSNYNLYDPHACMKTIGLIST